MMVHGDGRIPSVDEQRWQLRCIIERAQLTATHWGGRDE